MSQIRPNHHPLSRALSLTMIFFALSAWGPNVWANEFVVRDECERALTLVPLEQVKADLLASPTPKFAIPRNQDTQVTGFLPTFVDVENKALLLLQENTNLTVNPHESKTARDYASFVQKNHHLYFILLTQWAGRSTPVFDGLLADQRGNARTNVSLKYNSIRVVQPDIESLLQGLRKRLKLDNEQRIAKSPITWYRAAAGMPPSELRSLFSYDYADQIKWAAPVSAMFNLFRPNASPFGREMRVVVDLRDSGYDFDFVAQPEVLQQINELVSTVRDQKVTLTLLWSTQRVIEFDEDGFSIY